MSLGADATDYTRLPGRGRRMTARFLSGETQRLYVGGDHLLVLRLLGYEETSKRYALNDIQAITMQSNADRTILSAIVLMIMMVFAAIGLVVITEGGDLVDVGMYFVYIPMGICAFFLMANLALGPTCTVRLHTAVQIEDLTALRRQRAARKCLGVLVPRIEAVQGVFSGQPEQRVRASANVRIPRGEKKEAPKAIGRGLHAAAFSLTIVLGLSLVAEMVYEGAAKDIADTLLLAVSMFMLLFAAIRQTNSTLPSQTRTLTWAIFLGNGIAFMGAMYVVTFIAAFNAASTSGGQPDMMAGVVTPGQEDPRWFDALVAIWGATGIVMALLGLMSIRGYRLVERLSPETQGTPPP